MEGAPTSLQQEMADDPIAGAVMNGHSLSDLLPRQLLSAGMAATPEDSNGTPFNGSHVYASGNLVADMYSNVCAEATGRVLAARLWEMTDDAGMKDMLSFLIARDTMHQQQWLAVIEELEMPLPVPSDLPTNAENTEFSTNISCIPTARFRSIRAFCKARLSMDAALSSRFPPCHSAKSRL